MAVQISDALERVLILGDLKDLTPEQRVEYARVVGKSLGLNIATRPFDYILFREYDGGPERLELYLNARGAAQLRKTHRIGIIPGSLKREIHDEHCMVSVDVKDGWGTTDSATGSLTLYKMKKNSHGTFEKVPFVGREWDNAIMKCETKAKRRATLSICGLAMLDESQLDTMLVTGGVTPEGRIYRYPELADSEEVTGSHEAAQSVAEAKLEEAAKSDDPKIRAIAERAKPKKVVFVKTLQNHDIAVNGYLVDEPFNTFFLDVDAQKKPAKLGGYYWQFAPNYLEGFRTLCKKLEIEIADS